MSCGRFRRTVVEFLETQALSESRPLGIIELTNSAKRSEI